MNAATIGRLSMAIFTAVGIATTALAAPPPKDPGGVTSVKNVDEPGRVPYQQMVEFTTGTAACPTLEFCIVSFDPVPAGKRLVILHVTMLVKLASGSAVYFVAFGDGPSAETGNVAIVFPQFTNGGSGPYWALDRSVHVYFEENTTPKLKLLGTAQNLGTHQASVHGYLIDATNSLRTLAASGPRRQ